MSDVAETRQRIAVVGGGLAGLSAAWLLCSRHDVDLYEAEGRLGGHCYTIDDDRGGVRHPIDVGVAAYNKVSYENFTRLLKSLGIKSRRAEISVSVSSQSRWTPLVLPPRLNVFKLRRNLATMSFWRIIWDIYNFKKHAHRPADNGGYEELTIEEFLSRSEYSDDFANLFLLPLCSIIWATDVGNVSRFSASEIIGFFYEHGLLDYTWRQYWRGFKGGSRAYIELMAKRFSETTFLSTPVERIEREPETATVILKGGERRPYDHVVVAIHADKAFELLEDPTDDEKKALHGFPYRENTLIVHTDTDLMPADRKIWASWNLFSYDPEGKEDGSMLTVWMNRLLRLESRRLDVFVSYNPKRKPKPEHLIETIEFRHPEFTIDAIAAQKLLPNIQGVRRTWYCGAYFGLGMHEDALNSAIDVAKSFGVSPPWERK